MAYKKIIVPAGGSKITFNTKGQLNAPDHPIIPFIIGDGIGVDITPVMHAVVDAAVSSAYANKRRIHWMEIYAGEKATHIYGADQWLPEETLESIREFVVAIKGPLATPIAGGMRSVNVTLRQQLDLYVCLRPVRYFQGTPSPLKKPWHTDMVLFRENSEDIYAGIEWPADSLDARKLIYFLQHEMAVKQIRFPERCGIGIKPVSREGTVRLVRRAIQYAIDHHRPSVTLVHKGNIMKYTEGAFRDWGYAVARDEFNAKQFAAGPWMRLEHPQTGEEIIIKDVIADAFFQQILLRPKEYSVIATLNLNGDYIADALAAQVGGIGIAPGANIGDYAMIFEATHGTAPKYAGQDKVNPGSIILSAEMMLRYLGWQEAADKVIIGMEKTILDQVVTYDLARLMPGVTAVSCSYFGRAMIERLQSSA